MGHQNRTQTAGVFGIFGAILFFAGLLVEYRYGLFPPGNGPLFIANQITFFVAMSAILVMLWGLRAARAGGDGRFARVVLTVYPLGWAALILGGLIGLLTGNVDNLFFPLGGLSTMIFGLLAGLAVAAANKWRGWPRFALLTQAVYYLLVMMILPPLLTGSNEPTLLTESLWMATWLWVGLALMHVAKQEQFRLEPIGTGD